MMRKLLAILLACSWAAYNFGAATLQAGTASEQQKTIIIPHPWQMTGNGQTVELGTMSLSYPAGEDRLKAAGDAWAASLPKGGSGKTQVTFRAFSGEARDLLKKSFADVAPEALGDQGYFISIIPGQNQTQVDICAASERARFYGLQTLKQLVDSSKLHVVHVVDKPTLSRRGIPSGFWWWNSREELARRMAGYKMNYIYQGGSLLNGTFGGPPSQVPARWRLPFTEEERKQLAEFRPIADANFVEISFQMCPRGTPPTTYCGDEDIDLNVKKLSELYEMGFRNFGVNFDDLGNIGQSRIITEADKAKFGDDIGEAHRYFVQAVYDRLKAQHADIKFSFCPMQYNVSPRSGSSLYIQAICKLSPEITLVLVPSGDLEAIKEMLGRTFLVWDNFYARWETMEKVPLFLPPHPAVAKADDSTINGYANLPLIPKQEDEGMISWVSMADFLWSPDRYNPQAAEQAGMLRAVGSPEAAQRVQAFMKVVDQVEQMAYPAEKTARLTAMHKDMADLESFNKQVGPTLPEKFRSAIAESAERMTRRLKQVEERMENQPYPVLVKKAAPGSIIIGKSKLDDWASATTLTDFQKLGGGTAKFQTTVQLLHDGKNLLLRAVCEDPNPKGILTGSGSFRDDCLEMDFITRTAEQPAPATAAAARQRGRGGARGQHVIVTAGGTSSVKAQSVANIDEEGWTVEMAIPFESLGAQAVQPGATWLFNICRARQQMPDKENSSGALLFQSRFAAPSGKLIPMVLE